MPEHVTSTYDKARIVETLNRKYGTTLTVALIEIAIARGFTSWESLWSEAPPGRSPLAPIPLSTLMGFPIVEVDDIELHDASGPIILGTPISGTLSGVWDDGDTVCLVCIVCQQPFTPGPEGTGVLTHTTSGQRVGPICPACGIAIESPDA